MRKDRRAVWLAGAVVGAAWAAAVIAGCSGDDSVATIVSDAGSDAHPTADASSADGASTDGSADASADVTSSDTGTDAKSDAGLCGPGLAACTGDAGAYCANTKSDNANCGSCGHACGAGEVCSNGACGVTCGGSESLCTPDGGAPYCADLQNDRLNCNTCGNQCPSGNVCVNGGCQVSCPSSLVECGGTCIDPASNPTYCGASGDCMNANAGQTCASSTHGTGVCSGSTCGQLCATGYAGAACDTCATGYQDNDNNGTCTTACSAGACSNGGICDDSSGTLTCICPPGMTGADCTTSCPTDTAGASCDYNLVYRLTIPTAANWDNASSFTYDVDNSASVGAFTRVGYRLVLDTDQVWTEFDTFSANAADLGVPVDNVYQVNVTNEKVYSFSSNLTSTLTPADGNIEFFSNCYSQTGGNSSLYDYSDTITTTDCYGSMQVFVNQNTVFGFNRWSNSGTLDIGIGNQATGNPDWTFAQNATNYTTRTLEVYVK